MKLVVFILVLVLELVVLLTACLSFPALCLTFENEAIQSMLN